MMKLFTATDHSKTEPVVSSGSHASLSSLGRPNPFATPSESIFRGRLDLQPSGRNSGDHKYFRSRRIKKDNGHVPPVFKKDPKEKFLWIIPLAGLLTGLAIMGVVLYTQISGMGSHKYCPVLDDDFSSGVLNTSVWTREIEVGGFGNGQFEETTADEENVFIKDGMLYLKPTLQDEALITTNNIINLTASGLCTSDIWSNCVTSTNTTNGTIVQPVKSARLNTKLGANIKYGRVEVTARVPQGDWLWPAIWMLPVENTYGAWPASGEIDIMETRGNNHTYSLGGNDKVVSSLHWGPDANDDAYLKSTNFKHALHSEYGDRFHTYGIEWSEKYLFTYIDTKLLQVYFRTFDSPFWDQGDFPYAAENGTRLVDPWSQTGRDATPFDQEFYLILNVAVGGTNGWFQDGSDGKPWVDSSSSAKVDFWNARDQWYPTWEKNGQMIVDRVQMWQQC